MKTVVSKSKNIILRKKKSKDGYNLYLEFNFDGKRRYEFLGLKISGNVRPTEEDKFNLNLAERVKSQRVIEISAKRFNADDLIHKPDDFLKFFTDFSVNRNYSSSTIKKYSKVKKYLVDCFGDEIKFKDLTVANLEKFKFYLLSKLKNSSADTYFSALKTVIRHAKLLDLVTENNIDKVSTIKRNKSIPKYLTKDELNLLIQDKSVWEKSDSRKGFLFACFTGLRISDLRKLKKKHIIYMNGQYRIRWEQSKTKAEELNPIPDIAISFINLKKKNDELLFPRIAVNDYSNKCIKSWVKKLGITKPITFHSSRHTYATLLISAGVDLYTVSKLLGHSDIKVTQIYAKVVDKKKIEAVNTLPKFDI